MDIRWSHRVNGQSSAETNSLGGLSPESTAQIHPMDNVVGGVTIKRAIEFDCALNVHSMCCNCEGSNNYSSGLAIKTVAYNYTNSTSTRKLATKSQWAEIPELICRKSRNAAGMLLSVGPHSASSRNQSEFGLAPVQCRVP